MQAKLLRREVLPFMLAFAALAVLALLLDALLHVSFGIDLRDICL